MVVKELRDLKVWQRALDLAVSIYKITKKFPLEEKYNLIKHLRQCVRNIPGNIAEGFGRYHYRESMQFYRIARGSLNEVQSDLTLSFKIDYINKEEFVRTMEKINNVGKMLNGIINSTLKLKNQTKTKSPIHQ